MTRNIVFDVYEYIYGDGEISCHFDDLMNYMKRYQLQIKTNEMLIAGRACESIQTGDALFATDGTAYIIKGIYTYGHQFKSLDAGMSCAILTDKATHSVSPLGNLYNKPIAD